MEYSQKNEFNEKLAAFQKLLFDDTNFSSYKDTWNTLSDDNQKKTMQWFYNKDMSYQLNFDDITIPEQFITILTNMKMKQDQHQDGGSRSRRRRTRSSSRKYKKSAKRVFRKKSRSMRRR